MAGETIPKISKRALKMLDTKQSDNLEAIRERDRNMTMLDLFGGDEQKTAIAYYVSDMIAKGFNNQKIIVAIKDRFGIDWTIRKLTIVKDLVHKMWRAEMSHTIEDQIAKEIAVIDVQINEAWEGYEKSKTPKRKKHRTEHSIGDLSAGTDYDVTEDEENEEELAGDPKYLQIITDLGKERRKLLGLYAPEKKTADNGVKNAVQINVIGDKGGSVSELMNALLNPKGLTQLEKDELKAKEIMQSAAPAEEPQEAVVVETRTNIDPLFESFFD